MKKLRNFFKFPMFMRFFRNTIRIDLIGFGENKIMEVELWKIGNENINSDEGRAWEIIKEIYKDVLFNDEQWHFFYENFYNIIRCSNKFYPKLIKKLKKLDIKYKENGEWIDSSRIVERYKTTYRDLFHSFTEFALKEYNYHELDNIYDRISHCFFNHQFYILEHQRDTYGRQWESHLMNRVAVYRAEYTGMLFKNGIDASKSNEETKDEIEQINRKKLKTEESE